MYRGMFDSSQPIGRSSRNARRAHGVPILQFVKKRRGLCKYCCSAVNLSTKYKPIQEENKLLYENDHCTCSSDLPLNTTIFKKPFPIENEKKQLQDSSKTKNDSMAVYNIAIEDSFITDVNLLVSVTKDGVSSQYKINTPSELIKFCKKEIKSNPDYNFERNSTLKKNVEIENGKANSITANNSLTSKAKPNSKFL